MQSKPEIHLFGGHELSREGLRHILNAHNFDVRGDQAESNAREGQAPAAPSSARDIIIVDRSASQDALTNCRDLKASFPHARLVLLATVYDLDELTAAFHCGVHGYLDKMVSCEALVGSLKLIALGEKVLPSQLANNLSGLTAPTISDGWSRSVREVGLSYREIEILGLLTVGLANKVIARRMDISEATVKVHVKAVIRKLRVHNRTQAAIWAVKKGLETALPSLRNSFSSTPGSARTFYDGAEAEHSLEAAE